MNATRFLDTNILLYAYDLDAPGKRAVALGLVEQGWTVPGETAISVQVLQELHVNLSKRGLSRTEATRIVRDFAAWPVVDNTLELFQRALDEQERWKISLWDSLILAAARASGASELISEDLSHGQNYGGIRVLNPFL
jgi:predicted nucleic acid-binding protein